MFLFHSEFKGLRTSKPVLEFQSKGWQAQDTGRASVSVQVCRQEKTGVPIQKQPSKRNSPLLGRELSVRFRPSTDWMQLTHIREGNLLDQSAAAAAKSLQSCPTLCDPIDGSPPGSPLLGILQARILEWVAISFSNACMHAKSLQLCQTLRPYGQQPTRLSCPWDSPGKNTGVGCHFLLPLDQSTNININLI